MLKSTISLRIKYNRTKRMRIDPSQKISLWQNTIPGEGRRVSEDPVELVFDAVQHDDIEASETGMAMSGETLKFYGAD